MRARRGSMQARRGASVIMPVISLDETSDTPAYQQLYQGFRAAILSGRLRPGSRLPSTRDVADEMNLARNTVMSAFEQLFAEGYLQSRHGSGTFVTNEIPDEMLVPVAPEAAALPALGRVPRISKRGSVYLDIRLRQHVFLHGLGPFRANVPAIEKFPFEIWAKSVNRYLQAPSRQLLSYGPAEGHGPLREAIAEYLRSARAVRCTTEQVIVLGGSQQALHLCARVLTDPGDPVWIEEPGYLGARVAFLGAGAKLIPVPVDAEGLNIEAGIRREPNPRVIYVTPSHQYPLGATMSLQRRVRLLEFARKTGAWVIEDDYDSEYRYVSRPLSALQGLDTGSRVIYVGTFSKVLFPSLRLGYIVVPPELLQVFANAREEADIISPVVFQAALSDFMRQGHFARHIRRMRGLYTQRRDVLVEEIQSHLSDFLTVEYADSGMHLVALLPEGYDDFEAGRAAAEEHVITAALSPLYLRAPKRAGLILGFGSTDAGQIRAGVKRLQCALQKIPRRSKSGSV
jgi:GntR family transcriptional regulator / MocR family aminotransferase